MFCCKKNCIKFCSYLTDVSVMTWLSWNYFLHHNLQIIFMFLLQSSSWVWVYNNHISAQQLRRVLQSVDQGEERAGAVAWLRRPPAWLWSRGDDQCWCVWSHILQDDWLQKVRKRFCFRSKRSHSDCFEGNVCVQWWVKIFEGKRRLCESSHWKGCNYESSCLW